MPLISIEEIADMSEDTWTTAQTKRADMLLTGVLGWIKRNAPCLAASSPEPELAAEATMIVAEAILRAIGAGTSNVGSESVGPSSVGYVDRSSKPTLTRADEAALIALCPAVVKRKRYGTIRTAPGYLPSSGR